MSLPRTRKLKTVASYGKVMSMLFWDLNGPILDHYQGHGQMVNSSTWYYAMLEEELKPAIHSKHKRMLTYGVALHHDNAQAHTAAVITEIQAPPPCRVKSRSCLI